MRPFSSRFRGLVFLQVDETGNEFLEEVGLWADDHRGVNLISDALPFGRLLLP